MIPPFLLISPKKKKLFEKAIPNAFYVAFIREPKRAFFVRFLITIIIIINN